MQPMPPAVWPSVRRISGILIALTAITVTIDTHKLPRTV
jgi:hypothetical protein